MEALIPKLFILSAEASIVLFLLLIVVIIFHSRTRRKDIKAVNKMVNKYLKNKNNRLSVLKNQLQNIGFSGSIDPQAEQLYDQEKTLIKEFVSLYLQHDTERLSGYTENIIAVNDNFLKTTGTTTDTTVLIEPTIESSEENANAAILARAQEESHEEHLKELTELRLKNTELNEHLFEALETITTLMTEHGKKTGQEVDCNARKVLQAIIYLRDQRLDRSTDPSNLAPPPDNEHDKIEDLMLVDLAENDATLDDSTVVNLGLDDNLSLGDELDIDLDDMSETSEAVVDSSAINLDETDDDPWADALSEQASAEEDPWADALAEQAMSVEEKATSESEGEEDPWADALAEQATAEAAATEEEDPWAEALAEQKKSENK